MSAKAHTRRLSTDVQLCPEAQQLEAKARHYTKERRGYIQDKASAAGVSLKPLEMDAIYNTADGVSQGVLSTFKETANRELADFLKKNPDRVRYSALADWMNEDMNDQEKARREIASWLDNPKIAYFDTETTGFFDEGHVPVNVAACGHEDNKLVDIQLAPLNEKGEPIAITEGASKANHLTDAMLAGYQPLEESEWAIRELEMLAEGGYILTGYNTKFDRDMMCRAILWASRRVSKSREIPGTVPDDCTRLINRFTELHKYFSSSEHWLETKDTFCRAIGLEPYPGPGKYAKLEDIARATKALTATENQEHGALADCQLIARIVRNIRKELEDMAPKPKSAPVAKPAEEEPDPKEELKEYVTTLEQNLEELQSQFNEQEAKYQAIDADRLRLMNRVRELENLCEQYQQSDGIKHREAKELTWCDLEINGFRFNWTIREGETVEAAVESAFKTVRALQAIRDTDKVKTFRTGLRDNWQPLKGFDKPTNGQKPADDNYQPPANDKPAQPKGSQPPAANKPNVPPKPGNAPAPQQQPTGNPPQGNAPAKVLGEPASEMYVQVTRNEINGENTYLVLPLLRIGKPADKPKPVSKRDIKAFEKALADVGWGPASFETPGQAYDVNMRGDWVWGNPTDPAKPDGPRYHDNMRYTVLLDEPF